MADSLDYCIRLASPNVGYPLPTHGVAQWRWRRAAVAVRLPDVPKDHIVTASFSSLSAPASCAFRLEAGGKRFETAHFGHRTRRRERVGAGGVAVPVDYFHVERDLAAPTLSLLCRAPRPKDYLLVVSVRPQEVQPPDAGPGDVAPLDAPSLSQMTLPEDHPPERLFADGDGNGAEHRRERLRAVRRHCPASRHGPVRAHGRRTSGRRRA